MVRHQEELWSVDDFKMAIAGTFGNVSEIARNLECGRSTVYKYLEKYPELQESRIKEKNRLLEEAEFGVTHNIKVGNVEARKSGKSIDSKDHKFVLSRKSPDYSEKVEVKSENKVEIDVDPDKIDESISRLKELAGLIGDDSE